MCVPDGSCPVWVIPLPASLFLFPLDAVDGHLLFTLQSWQRGHHVPALVPNGPLCLSTLPCWLAHLHVGGHSVLLDVGFCGYVYLGVAGAVQAAGASFPQGCSDGGEA